MDVYDVYRGTLDPLEAWDLLVGLPPGANLWRMIDGPMSWEPGEWWAAAQVDLLREANWQRTEDGTTGRNRPTPIPRPADRVRGSSRRSDTRIALDRAAVFKAREAARREG